MKVTPAEWNVQICLSHCPVLHTELQAAAHSVGSALTSLLPLAASRESAKGNRNRTVSAGPKEMVSVHTKDPTCVCARLKQRAQNSG